MGEDKKIPKNPLKAFAQKNIKGECIPVTAAIFEMDAKSTSMEELKHLPCRFRLLALTVD